MLTSQSTNNITKLFSNQLESSILIDLLMSEDEHERLEVVSELDAIDFYKPFNQALFEKIKRQTIKTNGRVDVESIISQYEKEKEFDNPRQKIEELLSGNLGVVASDIFIALKRLKDFSTRRQLLQACYESQRLIFDFTVDSETVINNVQSYFLDIKTFSEDDAEKAYVVADEEIDRISHIIQQKKEGTYQDNMIYSGIDGYDMLVGGFMPGTYHVLAGRPGMGKTSFAVQLALNFSSLEEPCCIFSLEMTKSRFIYKVLSNLSKIDSKKFKKSDFDGKDLKEIMDANSALYNRNLIIDSNSNLNNQTLRTKIKFYMKKYGSKIFFIDYLQNMQTDIPMRDPVERLSHISREIQAIAKETNSVIFPLAQLNRDLEKRNYANGGKKPIMSDLKGAGQIEQDADSISFLYRDHIYNPDSNPENVEMILGKNRDGGSGRIELIFKPQFSAFFNKTNYY